MSWRAVISLFSKIAEKCYGDITIEILQRGDKVPTKGFIPKSANFVVPKKLADGSLPVIR